MQNHRPLREIVYEELKRQILIGEIAPGTRMMEVELADDGEDNFDISGIEEVVEAASEAVEEPKINSRFAIVLDRSCKAILYGKRKIG